MAVRAAPGDVVAWWDGADLACGVHAGEEKQRIRLVGPRGKETRVTAARIAVVVERGGETPGKDEPSRLRAAERVETVNRALRDLAGSAEVALLWELVLDDGAQSDLGPIAELAFGPEAAEKGRQGLARAAIVRAFLDDELHFVRRGDAWEPRSAEQVARLRRERETTALRAEEKEDALHALAGTANGTALEQTANPRLARYLEAVEELALRDLDTPVATRELALEAVAAADIRFDRPAEGAFRLLRRLGRFASDDENLAIHRYGLRTEFPGEVLEAAAAAAARGFVRDGREDFTRTEVVTIDSPHTREIDDALSLEVLPDGTHRIGVHIADPCAFVEPGDPVDVEAQERAMTYFFPEGKLDMIPPVISEGAASLLEGETRPTLSFSADVAEDGAVTHSSLTRGVVRSAARLSYDDVDRSLAAGDGPFVELLQALDRVARWREDSRVRAGAVVMRAPEIDVRVAGDSSVELERLDPSSPSRRLVSEAMILAGSLAAEFCSARALPVIYRRQPGPAEPLPLEERIVDDPVSIRRLRMSLRRGEVGLLPGPHYALGLPAYAQATSPLRRFQDLVNHRQLHAALDDVAPIYDEDAVKRIAATTERAEADGRRAEREALRYWLMRHLEAHSGKVLPAVVVDTAPRPVVLLEETLFELPLPAAAGATTGQRIEVRVTRVHPRADILRLELVQAG